MKTCTIIFALSFISSIVLAQAKVSTVGTLKGNSGGAAAASYAATGKVVLPSDTGSKIKPDVATQKKAPMLAGAISIGPVTSAATSNLVASKTGENPLYQGSGSTQENPLYKSEAKVVRPGQPIGGIIVKGGKNK